MNSVALTIWACLSTAVILTVILVRYRRLQRFDLELSQFISLILAVLGVVSSCELLHKAFTIQALRDLLGPDIVTLVVGAVAVIWVSAKEISKLF